MSQAKSDLAKRNNAFKEQQRELISARQDKEQLESEVRELLAQIAAANQSIESLLDEEKALKKQEAEIKVGRTTSKVDVFIS